MTRTLARRGLAAGLAVSFCTLALAAGPGFWQVATQADFLRGDVDQLSIDEHGRLTLGPEVRRVFDGAVSVVWTLETRPDGTTFLGTGNDGKVFKVGADGNGTLFYDSPELEVHALAAAPNGGLYVGTSPDGRIYRVDANGAATPFFDPDDKYIWSLATDAKGVLFAATGDKGTVYRITPDGKGEVFFQTKAVHAMTLRMEPSGTMLVGTGSPGRVFRVDTAGKGFLTLDTPYQEVRAIRQDGKGLIYAAALNAQPSEGSSDYTEAPAAPTPPATPSVSTEVLSFAIIDVPVTPQTERVHEHPRSAAHHGRRRVSHPAGRSVGCPMGVQGRFAVRPGHRGRRRGVGRHGRQGQGLPPVGRARAAGTGLAGAGPSRHRPGARRRAHATRHCQSRVAGIAVEHPRDAAAPTSRM